MLVALDSTDPLAGHDGMYPRGALLAANYSVPILWLSLFDTDGLVTWPGIHGSSFTAVVQPRSECIRRSRARLADWSRRWPEVFGDMPGPWLSYLSAVERAYLAVWAEELSWIAMRPGLLSSAATCAVWTTRHRLFSVRRWPRVTFALTGIGLSRPTLRDS